MADIFSFLPTGDGTEADKAVTTMVGTNTQRRVLQQRALSYTTLSFRYQQIEPQERLDLLNYFKTKRGKYSAFWVRTFHPDFVLTENGIAGQSEVYVEVTDLGLAFSLKPVYIYFRSLDFATRVVAVESGRTDPDTGAVISTKFKLAQSLPAAITLSKNNSPCQIERLYYCRFDQDTISFSHKKMVLSECTLKFRELPHETPSNIVHPTEGEH